MPNPKIVTDLSDVKPTAQPQMGPVASNPPLEAPTNTAMMRCPLPPIFASNPDSLRQFDAKGQIPQNRMLSPSIGGDNSTFAGTINEFVSAGVVGGGGSGSGGSGTASILAAAQQSLTTGIINPGQAFTGVAQLSRSFQLLTVTSNMATRIQAYGTQSALTLDSGRPIDVGPAPGTTQNLIFDIVLDTAPFQWSFQSVVGANGDAPQSAQMYVKVTNVGQTSAQATVTFLYVPLET